MRPLPSKEKTGTEQGEKPWRRKPRRTVGTRRDVLLSLQKELTRSVCRTDEGIRRGAAGLGETFEENRPELAYPRQEAWEVIKRSDSGRSGEEGQVKQ